MNNPKKEDTPSSFLHSKAFCEKQTKIASEEMREISSTKARALISNGGDLSEFLPPAVESYIKNII